MCNVIPDCLLGIKRRWISIHKSCLFTWRLFDCRDSLCQGYGQSSLCTLRFKCVCKTWQTLIVSPAFNTKHFVNYSSCMPKQEATARLLYSCPRTKQEEQFVYALPPSDGTGDSSSSSSNYDRLPFRPPYTAPVHVMGSSNGIVCLSQYTYDLEWTNFYVMEPCHQRV